MNLLGEGPQFYCHRTWRHHLRCPQGLPPEGRPLRPSPSSRLLPLRCVVHSCCAAVYFKIDATLRVWLTNKRQYLTPTPLHQPVRCTSIEVIEESDNPQFPLGAVIQSLSAMRSHAVYGPEDAPTVNVLDWTPQSPIPLSAYLTVFALSGGFTAMAGMTLPHLGNVKAGDVVLISAAAGHVGQLCCQIARLKGASKVIGIAGGDENCAFLKNELKVDEAIDYKKGNVEAAIKQAAPKGVNLYFDNVGREITNAVMNCMAMYGRIVCCGLVSTYNEDKSVPAVLGNFQNVLVDRLTIAGFICLDHIADIPNFAGQLVGWIQSGSLSLPPIEQEKGLENAIRALNRLLKGDKRPGAKMVVAVSAEPTSAS